MIEEMGEGRFLLILLLIMSALGVGMHNYMYNRIHSQESIADKWNNKFVNLNGYTGIVTYNDGKFALDDFECKTYIEQEDGTLTFCNDDLLDCNFPYTVDTCYCPTGITRYFEINDAYIYELKAEKIMVEGVEVERILLP